MPDVMRILARYEFWFFSLALLFILTERIMPWRKRQLFIRRRDLLTDVFWLLFNGMIFGLLTASLTRFTAQHNNALIHGLTGIQVTELRVLAGLPFWAQLVFFIVIADFFEYVIHNVLHRVGPLWQVHRIHHSITTMDWIGNYRFSPYEIIVYRSLKYLPLVILGIPWQVLLIEGTIRMTMGNLNHSNLNISFGPLRYILNSPRMHIWHHEKKPDRPEGYNFGVIFSMWDWLFGTAKMPRDQPLPPELGYRNQETTLKNILLEGFLPFLPRRSVRTKK